MKRRALLASLALLPLRPAQAAVPVQREVWRDAARGRDIPVLIRLPATRESRPAVLLSHGLGGSREGLGYLGRALAEAGFVAIHLQHPGTDSAVWQAAGGAARDAMAAAVLDAGQALARLQDGLFALDELARRTVARDGPLARRVDLGYLAMAGHSYGAWTVQHLLGQRIPGGDRGLGLPDPRLAAGIALSPSPPRGLSARLAFSRVATPMLHVTGTADHGWIEGATPADREIPYRAISGPPQALLVLEGANHGAFADEAAAGGPWADPTFHGRTAAIAVLFLRAVLDEDAEALAALKASAPGLLRAGDRLETKNF